MTAGVPPMDAAQPRLPYSCDLKSCFADAIGRRGLERGAFRETLALTREALGALALRRREGSLALLRLPDRRDDLPAIAAAAERLRGLDHVVVVGTGGSSLGARTLAALADAGLGPAADPRGRPKLWFVENIDPDSLSRLLDGIDIARSGLVVVSKSGGTAETLAGAHVVLPLLLDRVGGRLLAERALVVTEPGDNPLRRLAKRFGLPILDHDPDLGGRFSVLSVTGVLPAMIAGIDASALRDGARAALDVALAGEPESSPPAMGAALNVALARTRGVTQTVMMPYLDGLAPFAAWFCQLWAESLGKQGQGTTPIRAHGTVDQHSQLQLYLDGPADKLVNIVMGNAAARGVRFTAERLADPALDWLAGRTLGDLLDASARATAETLARQGRPVRIVRLGACDARTLGALLMHFMLETIIAAHLWGVDPFDQPAVEQGKALTRQYLGEMP